MKVYAITIKRLGSKLPTKDNYEAIFIAWYMVHRVHVPFRVYEHDSRGKLHMHGILECPKNFYMKHLIAKGFNLHLRELKTKRDREAWESYCLKDQDAQGAIDDGSTQLIAGLKHPLWRIN